MSTITITIDDKPYTAEEGQTVLQVARKNHIDIPTLCFHPALKPSGSCKLCAVEVFVRTAKRSRITMLACILKIKDGLKVETGGELVSKARTKAFRNLIKMAPQSKQLHRMAADYDISLGAPPDGCIRCRLCVRVCQEIVGAGALQVQKKEGVAFIVPTPDKCIGCGTCANICPTDAIRVIDDNNVRTVKIREEIIGKHPLERCEGCGRYFATPLFIAHTAKRTAPHPQVKVPHNYCPTCAKLFSTRAETDSHHPIKQRMPGH